MSRLVIFGLDCLVPELVLETWRDELPALRRLLEQGGGRRLVSTIPPITVPAWTAMMTSQDPGQLGVYGFRNRADHSYENLVFADARAVRAKTVWNLLSRARLRSLVMGVPQTYPPKPLNGALVGCFLTPGPDADYTYPPEFKATLAAAAGGEYVIDVKDFRTDDKERLLAAIQEMTRRRFRAFRTVWAAEDYAFAIVVEMGTDRIVHGFWRYFDRTHRLYEPGNPYENAVRDYYRLVDEEIGRTLAILPDDVSVMVVSDHGAKGMEGAICVNDWLIRQGYLALREPPAGRTKLVTRMIDWSRTRVWGDGGYYGRIFLNVAGREPAGVIPAEEYETFRDRLAAELAAIPDEEGRPIGTVVYKPEEIYRAVNGVAPDLIVYFGDLRWRSAGTVGNATLHLRENDTGPDDANHAQEGVFIWDRLRTTAPAPLSIYDVAPTVLDFFGLAVPEEMIGRPIGREERAG
ncbi:MAG: alkaline phosphatase family protein [Planctomycetes bacterium]|nr:alkaline phosphatase family protein [Planctomycetota bacterium]